MGLGSRIGIIRETHQFRLYYFIEEIVFFRHDYSGPSAQFP